MKTLEYLKSFGENVLQAGCSLFALASATDRIVTDAEKAIDNRAEQICLKSASGEYLDRWAWDLLKLRRKPLEGDVALRARILQSLFLANGTRTTIKKAVKILTGCYPAEIFEAVRDTAYFNAGYYLTSHHAENANAGSDGTGPYCAKMVSQAQPAYTGYVKVQLPRQRVGGAGLGYYEGREYFDAAAWAGDGSNPQRLITIDDLCEIIAAVKPAGTQVFLETF